MVAFTSGDDDGETPVAAATVTTAVPHDLHDRRVGHHDRRAHDEQFDDHHDPVHFVDHVHPATDDAGHIAASAGAAHPSGRSTA